MKKFWKIAGILTIVPILLGIGLVVLVQILVTPAMIKDRLLPEAEKVLQRRIVLGDIEVSLFSGIVLKDLQILEKTGDGTFVAADRIVLRYQLWPLLSKRVVVDEILLDAPQITLIRQADGNFNFSDLTQTASDSNIQQVSGTAVGAARTASPLSLLIAKMAIQGEQCSSSTVSLTRNRLLNTKSAR